MLPLTRIDTAQKELEAYKKEVDKILEYTKKLAVESKSDASQAIDVIAKSRKLVNEITEKKKELTREARDYVTNINNLAKDFLGPLLLVGDIITQKIDHWKIQNNETDQQVSQMEEFGIDVISTFEDGAHIRSAHASSYERISYTFELQDAKDVPLEYLCVDEEKVNQAIKNGIRNIPGLKIVQQTKTIIRSK